MPSAPEIKIGEVVLDRYRVIEQIGSGGHSVVFKGSDERLQRPVCIKVFSGLGGESGVGRTSYEHFVQEAFALSRLTHPNTLRIYDFGHLGPKDGAGQPLQVCEYMNGGTLSNLVREEMKLPVAEAVRITSAMCAALGEAHGLGIVHRDIKPQNILFGSVGPMRLPKLADFGIAKWTVPDAQEKQNIAEDTAIVAGHKLAMYSPSWAAPEQLAGQTVSGATDIYSLAIVMIYMLTGRAIFAEEDVYAGYKKRRNADEHVRDALAMHGTSRALVDVLTRALAFDPKQRIATVETFAAELATAIEPATEEQPRLSSASLMTPTTPLQMITPPGGEPVVAPVAASELPRAAPVAIPPSMRHPPVADPTPATFHAPAAQPWMNAQTKPSGAPALRIALADVPTAVANRRFHFTMLASGSADLVGPHGTKLRVTLLAGPSGQRVVHLKGLTCFVSVLGGRPSGAVTLERTSDVALVTPRAQEIGHIRVAQGAAEASQTTFQVGGDVIAVGSDDCADPILFDFGPGSDAYFVYTRGRTLPAPPKPGRRG